LNLWEISEALQNYRGPQLTFMEICGSHTAAISKYGIKELLSPDIRLISGPGCPVCVTPSAYIDRLIELAKRPNYTVVSFGDMLRVPGSEKSLSEAKGDGADAIMVYSPMDVLSLARENPGETYVFAAVGFETTAPIYTILLDQVRQQGLTNVKLLTSLKTMPKAVSWILDSGAKVHGFLAPGHVCAITGSSYFEPLAKQYNVPFSVSGFGDRELLVALYGLLQMAECGQNEVRNYYSSVVEDLPNEKAMQQLSRYFEAGDAAWRGMGVIENSGLYLKKEFSDFDAGSFGLDEDVKHNKACCCGQILMGKMEPKDCPLFGKICSPRSPQGACMVSYEGSCYHAFESGEHLK